MTKISPAKFRELRKAGREITLPSGLTVKIGAIRLESLVFEGKVPDYLTPVVEQQLTLSQPDSKKTISEQMSNTMSFLYWVAEQALIAPKLVRENPSDDELEYADLDSTDLQAIVTEAMTPVDVMKRFHEVGESDVASVDTNKAVGG